MTEPAPNHTPDVLILGAGINGAGLFRDLCEQGVTCVIIGKHDYGSGTVQRHPELTPWRHNELTPV